MTGSRHELEARLLSDAIVLTLPGVDPEVRARALDHVLGATDAELVPLVDLPAPTRVAVCEALVDRQCVETCAARRGRCSEIERVLRKGPNRDR